MQVDSRDDAYRWLMHWLSAHSSAKNSRNLSVSTSLLAFGSTAPGSTATETGVRQPRAMLDMLLQPARRMVRTFIG